MIADFGPYLDAQVAVDADWANQQEWRRRSVLTVARSGFFSSDRAIRQYAAEIWNVAACPVDMCCPLHP